jgi:hypothetical protein
MGRAPKKISLDQFPKKEYSILKRICCKGNSGQGKSSPPQAGPNTL